MVGVAGGGRELGAQNPGTDAVCEPGAVNPVCMWLRADGYFPVTCFWCAQGGLQTWLHLRGFGSLPTTAGCGGRCQSLFTRGCLLCSVLLPLPGLGCAGHVNGTALATGHLQRRSSLMTQPGLLRDEEKDGEMFKTWLSIESNHLMMMMMCVCVCVCVCVRAHACKCACSVVSDSLRPHGL